MKKIWENIGCFIPVIILVVAIYFVYQRSNEREEEKKAKAEAYLKQEEEKKEKELNEYKAERRRIGKYLYVDVFGTIHLHHDCFVFVARKFGDAEDEVTPVSSGVRRVLVSDFSGNDIRNGELCQECIDDDIYERLIETCENNKQQ